jgi:hypothetical protein
LETGSLTVELTPLDSFGNFAICKFGNLNSTYADTSRGFSITKLPDCSITKSLHFFVRRMLPAALAELLQFHAVRGRLPILGRRVIALFAITALHRNDFSGH